MEPCTECGYSYTSLDRRQIAPELRALASQYGDLLTRTNVDRLRTHPQPDVWSALEYACHVRDVHRVEGARILQAAIEDEPDFAPMRREERVLELAYNDQEPFAVAAEIRAAAATVSRTLDKLDGAGWSRTGVYHWPTTEVRTVDWIGRHTVHESVHHLHDITGLLKGREQ
jgi:hypothetical protein